eukprot:g3970.t1
MRKKKKHRSFLTPVISGSITGIFEISITYPLEFVKSSMQLNPKLYRGPLDALLSNVRTSGPLILYRGFPTWLFFAFPRNAVRFSAFEAFSKPLRKIFPESNIIRDVIAGLLAGSVESFLTLSPMQNISLKLTHDANKPLHQRRFYNFFPALFTLCRELGFRGLFIPGAFACASKAALNYSIRFPVFHGLKRHLESNKKDAGDYGSNKLTIYEALGCGAISGFISAICSHPLDVVKANLMGLDGSRFNYSSIQCAKTIVKENGVKGLYKGIEPRLCRVCMEMSLLFAVYEQVAEVCDSLDWL